MKKTTKWAKVFSIFLLLSFIAVNISGGPGPKRPKGNKTPMDIIAGDGDGCVTPTDLSPLLRGDTTVNLSCPGAAVPPNNRSFWNEMGTIHDFCIDPLTLVVASDPESGTLVWVQFPDDPKLRRVLLVLF